MSKKNVNVKDVANLIGAVNISKIVEDIAEYYKLKEFEETKRIECQEKFKRIRTRIQAVKEVMISGIEHHYQHLDKIYFQIADSQEKLMDFYSRADNQEEKQTWMELLKLCSKERSLLIQSENFSEIKLPKNSSTSPSNIEEI